MVFARGRRTKWFKTGGSRLQIMCSVRISSRSRKLGPTCSWGSIMRLQRAALVMIAPFSIDSGSVGSPSCAHLALVESSVSMSRGLMPEGVRGVVASGCVSARG